MFKKVTTWIKSHPYITGLVVVAVVLVFVVLRRNSSSGTTETVYLGEPSVSEAELAAGAQVTVASLQANTAAQQTEAQLMMGLEAANVKRDITLAEYEATRDIALSTNDAELAATLAAINSQTEISLAAYSAQANTTATTFGAIVDIATMQNEPEYRPATTSERVDRLLQERPDIIGEYNRNVDFVASGDWQGWDNNPDSRFAFNSVDEYALYWSRTIGNLPDFEVRA